MPRRRSAPLAGAAACLTALVSLWLLACHTAAGHRLDSAALGGFVGLERPSVEPAASAVAHLADPGPFILVAIVLTGIALLRGRPRVALLVPLILAAANVTTQALKHLLAEPRFAEALRFHQVDAVSFPSGHATGSMSLALCAVLVVGPVLRPYVAAVGALFAIGVGYAVLTLGWHYPSDVLGGYLVAATYTLLGLAALQAAGARFPERTGRRAVMRLGHAVAPTALVAASLGALAAAILVLHPERAISYAAEHTTFVASAVAIGLLGSALAAGLAAVSRQAR
jgi:membrane-associated phospholipid phosphatase